MAAYTKSRSMLLIHKDARIAVINFIRDCRRDGSMTARVARYWINTYINERAISLTAGPLPS